MHKSIHKSGDKYGDINVHKSIRKSGDVCECLWKNKV